MIAFSLAMLPESKIALASLWEQALPAVLAELADCGYTVDEDVVMAQAVDEQFVLTYRVEPGGATLTASTSDTDGSLRFILDGDRFGMSSAARETDPVLWMRLVQVGIRLGESYTVLPSVSDPDFPPAPRGVIPRADAP
jgi:hypothetical protein